MRTYSKLKSHLEGDLKLFSQNGIYYIRHIDKPNKFYIGSTFRNHIKLCRKGIYGRFVEHMSNLRLGQHHSVYLQNVANKYGLENIRCGIIEIVDDEDIILKREQHYMDIYKSYNKNYGFNISKFSFRPTISEKQRKLSSERMKLNNPMKNKNVIDKVQNTKNSNRNNYILQFDLKGNFVKEFPNIKSASLECNVDESNLYRNTIGKTKTSAGYIWIRKQEYSDDILKSRLLYFNRKHKVSDNIIKKRIEKQNKPVNMYSLNNIFIRQFPSIKIASEELFIDRAGISRAASGIQKTCGNYIWKFTCKDCGNSKCG